MFLLFDGRPVVEKCLRYTLICRLEDVYQADAAVSEVQAYKGRGQDLRPRLCFVVVGKQRNGQALCSRSTGSAREGDQLAFIQMDNGVTNLTFRFGARSPPPSTETSSSGPT